MVAEADGVGGDLVGAEEDVEICADAPYHEGQYVLTVDGFVVSDNVTVEQVVVEDTGFAWSDHNPVSMRFVLN